jgi:selenocysteine lyase/cysteine desulfurase
MTLAEILSNEDLRRHEFPVAREKIFLGHAAVCPLPRRVSEAIRNYALLGAAGDQEALIAPSQIEQGRECAARLLNARREEIAFVGPTSLALSFVAAGLPWQKGDNLLIYLEDYPANVYPWMALAGKGVEVRLLNARQLGRIQPEDVMGQIDEHTRLVALASNHFVAGYRLDVQTIGTFLRQRNILFCLDAIQTLGAFPTSVEHIDFLAADAHKWLLGPCGAGVFFIRKSVQEKLAPIVHGWHNIRCPDYIAQEQLVYRHDARRYEAGTANLLGLVGLQAAMSLLLEIGIEHIAAELLRKRALLAPALQAKGYTVLEAGAPSQNASGILSFYRQGADNSEMAALHQKLHAAGIETSLRSERAGRRYIRLSPHFYNTDAELHRTLEAL